MIDKAIIVYDHMLQCFEELKRNPDDDEIKKDFWNAAVYLMTVSQTNPFRENARYSLNADKRPRTVPCVVTAVLED